MEIPNQIKIGSNTITIERKPCCEIDNDDNGGWANWEHNKLVLANDVPEDREAVLFMHEILHFVNCYLTEEQATYVSEGLMQVIRDNNLDFRKL